MYNVSHDLSTSGYFSSAFGAEDVYSFTDAQTITCFDSWKLV